MPIVPLYVSAMGVLFVSTWSVPPLRGSDFQDRGAIAGLRPRL